MQLTLECRPTWLGEWAVCLRKDVTDARWFVRAKWDELLFESGHADAEFEGLASDTNRDDRPGSRVEAGFNSHVERELSREEGDILDRHLMQLVLPVLPEEAMGLDGVKWTLCIGNGWNIVELSWWPELPAAWRSLQPLLDYLVTVAGLPPRLAHPSL